MKYMSLNHIMKVQVNKSKRKASSSSPSGHGGPRDIRDFGWGNILKLLKTNLTEPNH